VIVVAVDGGGGIGFEQWRDTARALLRRGVPPEGVAWRDADEGGALFGALSSAAPDQATDAMPAALLVNGQPLDHPRDSATDTSSASGPRVPREFVETARRVACHSDESRWDALYRVLWRVSREGPRVLRDAADPDVRRVDLLERQVRFDAHKAKAFVRFRRVADPDGAERYLAWHRPQHRVLPLVAPFFARRFAVMRWSILTPRQSAHWDGVTLRLGPGAERPGVGDEALESLWLTYYGAIFNPARIHLKAMLKEMPRRYWGTMPEARLIDELLRDAPARVEDMMARTPKDQPGAEQFLPPPGHRSPVELARAARTCEGCELYRAATQVVFGEGPAAASMMLVGEQPGDNEDLEGKPFIGPAGRVLDDVLVRAGVERAEVYVTNAVKHFRWEERGKRRLHKRPGVGHVRACAPWLEAEVAAVRPRVIVALGSIATLALLGAEVRVTQIRGTVIASERWGAQIVATAHPSSILRMPDEAQRAAAFEELVADLRVARGALSGA
jgi:DNA polymerase